MTKEPKEIVSVAPRTGSEIVPAAPGAWLPMRVSEETARRVRAALDHALAANTFRAYRSDWRVFGRWCLENEACSLPAEPAVVAAFIADDAAKHKMSTVERRLCAISYFHKVAAEKTDKPEESKWAPTRSRKVQLVLDGLQRQHSIRPARKRPVDDGVLRALLKTLDSRPFMQRIRDRALLLVGFAGAFRRSALCSLDLEDLVFLEDRLEILIRRGKEDPKGKGRKVAIVRTGKPMCAVRAVRAWLDAAGIKTGPVFRGVTKYGTVRPGRLDSGSVAAVVKRAACDAGLDPKNFAAHSLRAGHITTAVRRGAQLHEIMETSGHRSLKILLGYIREADLVKGSSAAYVTMDEGEEND